MEKKLTKFNEFANKIGDKTKTTLQNIGQAGKKTIEKIGTAAASTAIFLMLLTSPAYAKGNTNVTEAIKKLTPDRTIEQVKNNISTIPGHQNISFGHAVPNYKAAAAQYKADEKILNDLLNFNAANMTREEAEKKIADYIAAMNQDSLKLALAYEALEYYNFSKTGKTFSELTSIARNGGCNDIQVNQCIERGFTQGLIALGLNTLSMERNGAHRAQTRTIDRNDGYNEVIVKSLETQKNGKRDLVEDTNAIIDYLLNEILIHCQTEFLNTGKNLNQLDQLKNNFATIKKIVNQKNLTENDIKTLTNLVKSTANILPTEMFGEQKLKEGFVHAIANQTALNKTLTKTKFKSINSQKLANANKFVLNPLMTANFNNQVSGFGAGMNVSTDINKNLNGELGVIYNLGSGEQGTRQQILVNANAIYNINEEVAVGAGIASGAQIDKDNSGNIDASFVFGEQTNVQIKLAKNIALILGFNALHTKDKSTEVGLSTGVTFILDNVIIKFGVHLGHVFVYEQQITPAPSPLNPEKENDNPIIHGGDIIEKPTVPTVDTGNMGDLPEINPGTASENTPETKAPTPTMTTPEIITTEQPKNPGEISIDLGNY